jgi:hypothetical protein
MFLHCGRLLVHYWYEINHISTVLKTPRVYMLVLMYRCCNFAHSFALIDQLRSLFNCSDHHANNQTLSLTLFGIGEHRQCVPKISPATPENKRVGAHTQQCCCVLVTC